MSTLTIEQVAEQLNGNEYREEGSDQLWSDCKRHGIVVVFGASDDLMEFRGAIYDEASAYNGTTVFYLADPNDPLAATIARVFPALFKPLIDQLLDHDPYLLLADFDAYVEAQQAVGRAFRDQATWHKKAVLNIAHMGRFSSDRTIREYATRIWHVDPAAD